MCTERVRITFSTGLPVATMWASFVHAFHWYDYGARGHRHDGVDAKVGSVRLGCFLLCVRGITPPAERTHYGYSHPLLSNWGVRHGVKQRGAMPDATLAEPTHPTTPLLEGE
jgi:hypothetical protein